jgi:hypothetical protein
LTLRQPTFGHGANARFDEEVTIMVSRAIASLDAWLARAEEVLEEQRQHALSPSEGAVWDRSEEQTTIPASPEYTTEECASSLHVPTEEVDPYACRFPASPDVAVFVESEPDADSARFLVSGPRIYGRPPVDGSDEELEAWAEEFVDLLFWGEATG